MKNTILKTSIALALSTVLFTGCTDFKESDPFNPSSVGNKSDSLVVLKTISPKGFTVLWIKKAGSYGEVSYTDSLSKKRGNGTPLTSNSTGGHSLLCTMTSSDTEGAKFSCKPSNVSSRTSVYLRTGVEYKWLVNYGFSHEKGEVEATMEYHGDGTITVE